MQGRNITVKLADNYKGKISQPQLPIPTAVVPVPLHMTAGYQQSGGGYNYPQPIATYPTGSYSSPPTVAPPYASHPQYPYPQYNVKKGSVSPQTALGGYPYYMHQQ